ncbi:hypothetical protein [Tsuneonella flava]|uniref:hypothetical protein n=1 Tax=Tsuneonella flava TaxID=2055955 RepID=UPI0018E439C8|nr:hypothetical protein [Tsuneonella flava]
MTASQIDPPAYHRTRQQWEQPFLQSLARLKFITRAAEKTGIAAATVHARKRRDPDFARAIKRAVAQAAPPMPGVCEVASRQRPRHTATTRRVAPLAPQPGRKWRDRFIQRLGETSNVAASAAHAHISTREVYALRRSDPTFAAAWQSALYEGYLNLEMEVLGHLRDPAPERKLDVASALRLLSAHRETVAKERAVRTHMSKAELRESLARKVDALRRKIEAERATDAELDRAADRASDKNTSGKEPRDA